MWVKFRQDFDFSPAARGGRTTIAYKAGMVKNVTTECANLAVGAGKANRMRKRNKAARPIEAGDEAAKRG